MDQEIQIPGFELLDKIGEGGRGAVYRARQLSLDRLVAIKILRPTLATDAEYTARFLQEARAAAKLSHPNIVQAIEVGEHEGVYFFVMELVEGGNLLERLQRNGVMTEGEALEVASQTSQALDFAWTQAGMIHRDIKPANILLTPDGRAKLADLGLAMRHGASPDAPGYIEGTPQYCPPEQCRGEASLDTRADLYALGATLYHLVCGGPPFDGDDPAKVMAMQITHPVEPPRFLNPGLSMEFEAMTLKLLAKDPADRFQSPAELIAEIQRMRAPQPEPPPAPSSQPPAEPVPPPPAPVVTLAPRPRLWAWLGIAAAGVVALLVLALVMAIALGPAQVSDPAEAASKSGGVLDRMTAAFARATGRSAASTNIGAAAPLPAAPLNETAWQRVRSVFRKSGPASSVAASLRASPYLSTLTQTAARLAAIWKRPVEQVVAGWKILAIQPEPPPATPLRVAVQTPPPSPPAPPPSVPPAPLTAPPVTPPTAQPPPATPAPVQPATPPIPPASPPPAAAPPPPAIPPPPQTPPSSTPPSSPPPAPVLPAPPPAPPANTNMVVASLTTAGSASTSELKRVVIRPAKAVMPPALREAAFQNAPINLEVQRVFRRKDVADASTRGVDARSNYLETTSLRIILRNMSPQAFTNVIVRWAIVKRAVGRSLTSKDICFGAEEKLEFKPIERKVIETPVVEAGGVMSTLIGRAYGEMIKGHGVQVIFGTNCVAEETVPASLKISYKNLQPVPKPAP